MKKTRFVSLFLMSLLTISFASASETFQITVEENLYYGYPNVEIQESEVWRQALQKCDKTGSHAVIVEKIAFSTKKNASGDVLYLVATGLFSCKF